MALAVPLSRFTPRVGGGSAFFVRAHRMHDAITVTVLLLLLYWGFCCGIYYLTALAFVWMMSKLVVIPKGWKRRLVWFLLFTPFRIVVIFTPLLLGCRTFSHPLHF